MVGLRTPSYELAHVWQNGEFLEGYLTRLETGEALVTSDGPLLLDRPGDEEARLLKPDAEGIVRFPMEGDVTMRLRVPEEE